MADFKTPLLIAALAGFATFAQAQDTATPAAEAAPAAEAPATEAPATEAPSAAAPGEPTEGVGSAYLAETFDAWALRCVRTEDGNDPCQLYQLLTDKNGTAVADVSIFPILNDEKVKAGATVMTPLGTLLNQNLVIRVDEGQPMVYPYTFCTTEGCAARLALTDAEIAAFKRGKEAMLTIVPAVAPDQKVNLTISLKGFTAAFDAINKAAAQ